jgi:hypothetical protein
VVLVGRRAQLEHRLVSLQAPAALPHSSAVRKAHITTSRALIMISSRMDVLSHALLEQPPIHS